jgi:hypothetical protein
MRFEGFPLTTVLHAAAGALGGWAFYVVWRRLMPRERSRVFWQSLPVHAVGLLRSDDPDDTLRHYGALMKQTASFAAMNTLAVIAGLVPVVILYALTQLAGAHRPGILDMTHMDLAFLAGLAAGSIAAALWAARARAAA